MLAIYWEECNSESSQIQIRSKFFSAENCRQFISKHPSVNKKLLCTHLNKILNTVYNGNDDLTIQPIQVNLQSRPEFSDLLPNKNNGLANKKQPKGAVPLSMDQFQLLLKNHNECDNILNCYMLVQCALSIRYDNLKNINSISCTTRERNCKCCLFIRNDEITCPDLQQSCMHQITFKTSKTGNAVEALLSPLLYKCFCRIRSTKQTLEYEKYNSYIKTTVGASLSSHSMRKFIPNMNRGRNVANWQSLAVLSKHYLDNFTLLADFHNLIRMSQVLKHESSQTDKKAG